MRREKRVSTMTRIIGNNAHAFARSLAGDQSPAPRTKNEAAPSPWALNVLTLLAASDRFELAKNSSNLARVGVGAPMALDAGGLKRLESQAPTADVGAPKKAKKKKRKKRGLFGKIGRGLKKAARSVGKAVKSVAKGAATIAKGVAKTAFHAVKGIGEGVGGFVSNLAKGKVGDAFDALGRGIDQGILQAPSRLAAGVFDGAKQILDGATSLMGPLGKPINTVATRALDGARTAVDTVTNIAREVIRTPFEVAKTFVSGQWDALKHLAKGDFKEAAKSFGRSFSDSAGRAIGGVADVLFHAVAGVGSIVGTAVGLESPGRPLSDAEKREFQKIYGDSVDLDLVRVKKGGLGSVGAARTVGNTVYLPGKYFDASGRLNADGKETLAHEMGHVWQNQNGGGDYMHRALWAQAKAAVGSGSRSAAYDWHGPASAGVAFRDLNPEQQAHVIEDITLLLRSGQPIAAGSTVAGHTLSAAEAAYLNRAWAEVKAGAGAP